jgi:hypothetical protein
MIAFIGAGPVYFNSIERHACFCSSLQFFHRRRSVAYHTIIHLLLPFIQAPRAISIVKSLLLVQISLPTCASPTLHIVQSLPSTMLITVRLPKFPLLGPSSYQIHPITTYLHATSTSTPLQVSQVLPASSVPRGHVLLHAVGETGLLGGRDGRAGVGDCALEAVLVDFL